MQTAKKDITVSARTDSLSKVRAFVEETVRAAGFSAREADLVILAIDEAVTNIVCYSDHHGTIQTVKVTIEVDDVRLRAVIDEGATVFDLPPIPNGEMSEYVKQESAYQMGILLIRRIMDEISYSFKKGFENSLAMIKYR